MAISRKTLLAALAGAALLSGCATGPYYDEYGYGYGYDAYGPNYYGYPGYAGPSIGLGFTYSDRDYRRERRGDRREWRGEHRDRDGDGRRDWRGDRQHDREESPIGHGGPGGSNPRDGGSPG